MADMLPLSNNFTSLIDQFNPGKSPYGGPFGPGLLDVYDYEKNRHLQDQAKGLALNQAKVLSDTQTSMIEEYNAGAPGRKALTEFANESANAQLKNKDMLIAAQLMQQQLKGIKAESEIQSILGKDMDDFAMEYYTARNKDKASSDSLLSWVKANKGDMRIKGKAIKDIPDDILSGLIYSQGSLLTMKQKSATIGGEIIKQEGKKTAAEIAANAGIAKAMINAQGRIDIERLKVSLKGANKTEIKNIEQAVTTHYNALISNEPDEQKKQQLINELVDIKVRIQSAAATAGPAAKAEATKDVLNTVGAGAGTNKPATTGTGQWGAVQRK